MGKEAGDTPANEDGERIEQRKRAAVSKFLLAMSQAVLLHTSALQSELTLFSKACNGNAAATSRALAMTNATVGVVGLFFNQIGGKLSDSLGRKPFFLIGPLVNIACGMAVLRNSRNLAVLKITRVLKSVLTTFSGTVMLSAALSDIMSGAEQALLFTRLMAAVGVAVVAGPYFESGALKLSNGNPLAPFKVMMALSTVQLATYLSCPETLSTQKALGSFSQMLADANPFAFLKVYFGKSAKLKKLLTITTLQYCNDGKVTSDLFQQWARNNLQWTPETTRDFVACWGAAVTSAGFCVHPYLLKKLSTFAYSTVGNLCVGTGLAMHGLREHGMFMWGGIPFLIPGVNGGSVHALRALMLQVATKEGYGNGEFAAWSNNLRVLAQSMQIVFVGRWYATCKERGIYPGTSWFLVACVGGFLPQLLMMTMHKKEFEYEPIETPAES